jgi:O-antigen/teichoic acid export membrane protein
MNWALLKNSGIATFGVLIQGLARFAYTILIGRVLGAQALGEVSSLLALAVFVSLFWPTASGVAASRFIPRDRVAGLEASPIATVITRLFLVSLPFLAVATFVVAFLISHSVGSAVGAVILMTAYSAYAFTRGAALGSSRFLRVAVMDTVSSFAAILLLCLVLISGWHWAVLLPLALGYAVFAAANWPARADRGRVDRAEAGKFIAINSIAQVATGGLLQVAMLAASLSDTPHNAGLFAAALSLATPAAMLGQSLNQVLIPHFARMHALETGTIRASTIKVTAVVAAGLGVVFGVLALAAPLVVELLYGNSYQGASDYMRALLMGVYIYAVSLVPAATLIATARDRRYTVASVIGFVMGVIAIVVLAPSQGAWAAEVGYVAGAGVSAVLTIWWGTAKIVTERAPAEGRE